MDEISNLEPQGTAIEPLDDYEAFLSKLGERDRQNVERHVAACETESSGEHVKLWKRLAGSLARLAPHATQTAGQRAVRFYVSDGKYRRQLFALEDLRDGNLVVYVVDALKDAIEAGVLRGPLGTNGDVALYEVCDEPGTTVKVELLAAAKTTSAPEYFKHMLGWNRKALKVTVPTTSSPVVLGALHQLCDLAVRQVAR